MNIHGNLERAPGVATRAVTVRVTRQFNAMSERVFDAWLDPVTARTLLFATDTGEIMRSEIDSRIGGRFRFVHCDNDTDVERAGEYIEIDRPHLLVFSLYVDRHAPADDRVIIELAPVERGSLLVLTHEMSLHRHTERHRIESEWTTILGVLATICTRPSDTNLAFVQQRRMNLV